MAGLIRNQAMLRAAISRSATIGSRSPAVSSFRSMSSSSDGPKMMPPRQMSGPQRAMIEAVEDDSWSAQQRTMTDRVLHAPPARTEEEIRMDLQTAHRLMARYGFDDLVWNHISARCMNDQTEDCCDLPTDTYLITPGGMHFSEIRSEDLVFDTIAESGNVIHSGIYAARPDVRCIIHAHTPAVMAVSALEEGFMFLTQDSAPFFNRIGYHNWEGLTGTEQEEQRIASSLGDDGIALIMRNHGATVVGRSVQEAFVRMYYLNRCCQTQLDVLSTGRPVRLCPDDVLIHAADQIERFFPHGKYEWRALTRLVNGH